MISDGRPYTNENGRTDAGLITDLNHTDQQKVFDWIDENIHPAKTWNRKQSSYSLKHHLERDTGIYLTNNRFKDAMWLCGYEPQDANRLNWYFRIRTVKNPLEVSSMNCGKIEQPIPNGR